MADKDKPKDQATRTKGAEYGGSSTAAGIGVKNKSGSSAQGPYQILNGTWKDLEKVAKRKLDRNSVADNDLAFELYTKQSEKALEQSGIEINPGNTYALHVFGQKGGVDYLRKMKSNPEGLSTDGMPAEVIKGNKAFFFDESGKPRTNAGSYGKLSSRVGGPSDPGAISLAKNQQKAVAQEQMQQQAQMQQAQQVQQEQQQVPEEQQQEQAPEQQQIEQQAPEETSELSRASNTAGMIFNGDRSNPGKFILPQQEIQEDIKTSGDASMKAKTFAYGGPINPTKGAATRQDSINLKEDSLRLLKEYQSRGYKESAIKFPENNSEKSLAAIKSRKGTTEIIRNGIRNTEKYDPSEYRQDINEHQYRQRESANGVLNMDVTPALYDKRVAPTSYLNMMGEKGGTFNDGVSVPYYGDMKISPAVAAVKKQPVGVTPNRVVPTARPVVQIAPKTVYQAPVANNIPKFDYTEKPGGFTRDNTRVGTSFSGVDPRLARKANMFAEGGEVNNGLLNDFNEGGSHEENPNGGVAQGMNPNGEQNTVEEGETKMGQYVFSDRLKLEKADVENLYLPKETEGMTYAEASKFINEFLEENAFDIIIKRTAKGQLDSLKIGNDRARKYKQESEQIVAETDNPEMAIQQPLLPPQETERTEETQEVNPDAQQEEAPVFAYGGNTYLHRGKNKLEDGGNPLFSGDGALSKKNIADTTSAGVGVLGAGLSMGAEAFQKYDTSNLDNVIQKQGTGMAVASGAAKMAAAGAALGPWGALAGGVFGGLMGGIGAGGANRAANKQAININGANFNKQFGDMAAYGGEQHQMADGGPDPKPKYKYNKYFQTDRTFGYEAPKSFNQQLMSNPNRFSGEEIKPIYSPQLDYNAQKGKLDASGKYSAMLQESVNNQTAINGTSTQEPSSQFKMKGDNMLKYAGAAGALSNYLGSRKEKARQINSELMQKTSTPNYYDEAIIQNQMNQEVNNRSQAILATSGGSAAAARAMSMAGNSEISKMKNDAYFKMQEVNNGIRDRDQAESQRIADANTGIRNNDYQANLAEQDYVLGRKEKARDNLFQSVQAIGQEQSDKNLIYNLSRGYKTNGTYDPEGKESSLDSLINSVGSLISRNRKASGGLLDLYDLAQTKTKEQEALDFIKKKYNG